MGTEFLHLGDPHQGYLQYGSRDRFTDFARSLNAAMEYAIRNRIKLVLIPGDLFHSKAIDPLAHTQTARIFDRARKAGIVVVDIEGNHDNARYRDTYSWISNLNALGYMRLLSVQYGEGGMIVTPWDDKIRTGSYVDHEGLRVYGIQYAGASTAKVVKDFAEAIPDPHEEGVEFSILCMHAGMEGVLPGFAGGLSMNDLEPLRGKIDYIALGHIHKRYELDNWIMNPGSLEPCSMEEALWKGGFYRVSVERARRFNATHVSVRKRPFTKIEVETKGIEEPERVYMKLAEELVAYAPAEGTRHPVVEVALRGQLLFARSELDLSRIEAMVREVMNPIAISDLRNETVPADLKSGRISEHRMSKAQIELSVFGEIALRDARFAKDADHWAAVMGEVKRMAMERQKPEFIIAYLEGDEVTGPAC